MSARGLLSLAFSFGLLLAFAQQQKPVAASHQATSPFASPPDPNAEVGLTVICNYLPDEYASLTPLVDTWCVLEDNQGRMMIGNAGGILLYNGHRWQYLETPTKSIVRSMAKDKTGRIYVGASDDMGYLAPDKSGKLQFISLLSHLPESLRKFGDIRRTVATPEGIYFQSSNHLFYWSGTRFREWTTETTFSFIDWVNGQLYVQQAGKGLYTLSNGQLRLVSDQPPFTESDIAVLLAWDQERLLVGTRNQGLFQLKRSLATAFPSNANSFLRTHTLYCGIRLPDGNFAFGTLRGGLLLMNSQGAIERVINKAGGLRNDAIYHMDSDDQHGLWLATSNGVSRVEVASPFSMFDESNGLVGNMQELCRYQGRLYASTSVGLFVLHQETGTGKPASFQPLPGFDDGVLRVFLFGDQLIIAGIKNLYQLRGDKLTIIRKGLQVSALHRCRRDPNLVLYASDGLFAMRWTGTAWKDEGAIPGIHEDMHRITENEAGDFFMATRWQGTLRIRFPQLAGDGIATEQLQHPTIDYFGVQQGLPAGVNRLYWAGDRLFLRIGEYPFHLFQYDQSTARFQAVPELSKQLGLDSALVYPAVDTLSAPWWWTRYPANKQWHLTQLVRHADGSASQKPIALNNLPDHLGNSLYLEGDTVVWLRGKEGVARFHLKNASTPQHVFQTVLERLSTNSGTSVYPNNGLANFSLPFSNSILRFDFSAPSYDYSHENEFQYQLEGFDDRWSGWTKEAYKEYTRLPSGTYLFRVKSRNIYGDIGQEATFLLVILPPWYLTWPLYLVYAALVAGGMYGLVRWRSATLRSEKVALEKIVRERTAEIEIKNQQLQDQAHQLENKTRQLRELDEMKSHFFANISHEFRTPLTLILGIASDKLGWFRQHPNVVEVPVHQTEMGIVHRNAQRLLQLISQLLDLSKIEFGQMKLRLQEGDLKPLLHVIMASFSSLARHQQIRFHLNLPPESIRGAFDSDQMEKIFYNLLSNAFKFTPDGGEINIGATWKRSQEGQPADGIRLVVQDSGHGIPTEQLTHVFERFFQVAKQYRGDQHGTGIGLALTKELVQLHGGEIWVESESDKGARFIIDLPGFQPGIATADQAVDAGLEEEEISFSQPTVPLPNSSDWELDARPMLLIVEDNEDLRQYMRGHLQEQYRVLESENGSKGWEMALATIPDLIISDWMMPDMDGIELCRRIKADERTSHIPFVLLTALATYEGKLTGLETGADDYLTKPFDARELETRIRNLIDNRKKLRERFGKEVRLQPTGIAIDSADEKFLRRLMKVAEEFMGDSEFGSEQFSREVGLSRMQLHRKLSSLTGQTTSDFLRTIRLKRAAQLLEAQTGNVSEIAYSVGFSSLSYFSKSFRDHFGIQPTEYVLRHMSSSTQER